MGSDTGIDTKKDERAHPLTRTVLGARISTMHHDEPFAAIRFRPRDHRHPCVSHHHLHYPVSI
ncbi:hypothetical protein OH76DRAFT_664933 [Lentinus brumalis]|uniref:Uncharacterized protein n=1 Tax=Lentinus brumalis TaxID=2498619 RepID=A0A371D6Z9_9APHY|nr:hypothetical protein OH76DRAFT_664933 [Polyporus brumalis]